MDVTRVALLRSGYGALGVAFVALAAGAWVPGTVIPGLAIAFLAGVLLAFSGDEHAKWAGVALVVYFVVTALAFVVASGATIKIGEQRYFFSDSPPAAIASVTSWITLFSPLMLGAVAVAATWDRERAPRILLAGAIAGFVLVAVLTVTLDPTSVSMSATADEAEAQGRMLQVLFAVSAFAGATGALWAAGRPDSA